MGAGLCGVCLYYLLENIALTFTMASNVGVIISVAPFFYRASRRIYMGMLFHPDPEDQFLRIQYHPDYQESISLWASLHDTGAAPVGSRHGFPALCRQDQSAESSVSRTGCFRPLLCHMEFRCPAIGSGQNQRLYLPDPCNHHRGFCPDPARAVHLDDRDRNCSDTGRSGSLGGEGISPTK